MSLTSEPKSTCLSLTTADFTTAVPSVLRTSSARPLPYSEASSTTKTFFDASTFLMYRAAPGPCEASLPSARWKVLSPCCASFGFVADAVRMTTPALLRIGLATLDSPEKAGPTTPRILASCTTEEARPEACAGSPAESFSTRATLQSAFCLLYWSRASLAPSRMLMPSWALPPVSAPKNAILLSQFDAAVVPPLSFFLAQAAEPPTRRPNTAMPPMVRARTCLKVGTPPPYRAHRATTGRLALARPT